MPEPSLGFNLTAIATRTPDHPISQQALSACAQSRCASTQPQRDKVGRVFDRTTVKSRACVVASNGSTPKGMDRLGQLMPLPTDAADRGPSIGDRMRLYEREALPLAIGVLQDALERASVKPQDVSHLVAVSCTGFIAPGLDLSLIERLGLPPGVGRTSVGFMGCHGALNGLRVMDAMGRASPGRPVAMVCVELCSIHFQYGYNAQHVVANALFADGAAAVVGVASRGSKDGVRLLAQASTIVPDSSGAMAWRIRDHGFEMTLSPEVPALVKTNLRPWLTAWLSGQGLTLNDIQGWAIHPGGPKVIDAVASSLGLTDGLCEPSRSVLAEHGNMSSPTVLFIVERLIAQGTRGRSVVLAFGPGLVIEAALLDLA